MLSIQLEIALGFFSGSSTDFTALKTKINLFSNVDAPMVFVPWPWLLVHTRNLT